MRNSQQLTEASDLFLQSWYKLLNKVCFDNKLPRRLKVASGTLKGLRGVCLVRERKVLGILVNPLDPEPVQVLLHEMVHAFQTLVLKYPDEYPDHDHAFWQKLKVSQKKLVTAYNSLD